MANYGRSVLNGGSGASADRLDFTAAPAADNADAISDFGAGDRVGLASAIFAVGPSLEAGEFVAGTAAADADDRILYDAGTGRLLYDADGDGAGAAVPFALVAPGTAITSGSFQVI
ncbi:hypothetical protein [Sphingomonas lenta]|uniref:RapA2 cadherin-like domain-containing protein n=1 Tax=Sphingomonas lenta TaxID=1141887 RepID=A0A2A2SDG6_9SPHN|nr:hypothetical protein [Sphingomonas lenta]PAX07334.1 hypothetical protein CKY28_15070 [Sphingomonas lenta]